MLQNTCCMKCIKQHVTDSEQFHKKKEMLMPKVLPSPVPLSVRRSLRRAGPLAGVPGR